MLAMHCGKMYMPPSFSLRSIVVVIMTSRAHNNLAISKVGERGLGGGGRGAIGQAFLQYITAIIPLVHCNDNAHKHQIILLFTL